MTLEEFYKNIKESNNNDNYFWFIFREYYKCNYYSSDLEFCYDPIDKEIRCYDTHGCEGWILSIEDFLKEYGTDLKHIKYSNVPLV